MSSVAFAPPQTRLPMQDRPDWSRSEESDPSRCILVVHDNEATRSLIVGYLEDYSMRVIPVSPPQDAVRLLATGAPHLVILNLQSREHGGLDLLRTIRSRSDVPVILITEDAQDETDR